MSADNWAKCPRCLKKANEVRVRKAHAASESYGKVSADEYARLLKDAAQPVNVEETFREDYECGTDESGNVFVSYHGCCQMCGLEVAHRHEEQLKL